MSFIYSRRILKAQMIKSGNYSGADFYLGQSVEVDCCGRGKWFVGKIAGKSTDKNGDLCFEIDFDDGLSELNIPISLVRPIFNEVVEIKKDPNGEATNPLLSLKNVASFVSNTSLNSYVENKSSLIRTVMNKSISSSTSQEVNITDLNDEDNETEEERDERLLAFALKKLKDDDVKERAVRASSFNKSSMVTPVVEKIPSVSQYSSRSSDTAFNKNDGTVVSNNSNSNSTGLKMQFSEGMYVEVNRRGDNQWTRGRIMFCNERMRVYDIDFSGCNEDEMEEENNIPDLERRVPEYLIRPCRSAGDKAALLDLLNLPPPSSAPSNAAKRSASANNTGANKKAKQSNGTDETSTSANSASSSGISSILSNSAQSAPAKVTAAMSKEAKAELKAFVKRRNEFECQWKFEEIKQNITAANAEGDVEKVTEWTKKESTFNFNMTIKGSASIADYDELYALCCELKSKVDDTTEKLEQSFNSTGVGFQDMGRCKTMQSRLTKLCEEVNAKRTRPAVTTSEDTGLGPECPMNFIPPSQARADWERIKSEGKKTTTANKNKDPKAITPLTTEVKALDDVMGMTGLESVKRSLLDQYNRLNIAKLQGMEYGASNYNTRFDGNPGTGKTTVARLYAEFLTEVGVLPEDCVVEETTGSALKHGGISELEEILENVKKAKGGVIFVDEAYQLDDSQGRKILDFILVHAERLNGNYGALVWIFAGYNKKMDKLFEYNIGLPSRFPTKFNFEDYTDAELLKIWNGLLLRGGKDVVKDKPAKEAPPPKPAAPTTIALPNNNPYAAMYGYNAYNQPKPDQVDEWGNTWKWNVNTNTYEDEYNNITGMGNTNLGSAKNPVVSRTGNISWCYNRKKKEWFNSTDHTVTRSSYPGKPEPVKAVEKPKEVITPFIVSDLKWSRVAIRRLGCGRGRDGFGNARAVRNLFDLTLQRQSARLTEEMRKSKRGKQDLFVFVRDDLLGPMATEDMFSSCAAWKTLQEMEGLKEVKESVRLLLNLVVDNACRENEEKPLLQIALNRIFLGNPGTGKTTVAKLYARILNDFGLLSKGEVIIKNPSDFKGNVVGNSEMQTRAILEGAMGSVLVIDEAYGLSPSTGVGSTGDPYSEAVIQTIVEQVQGVPGEDRAVVMLGYRMEMERMLANCNPGLARRFQLDNAFQFSDYDDAALKRILIAKVASDKLGISDATATFAITRLAKAKAQPNFGNAGAVNNLLSEAKLRMQNRQKEMPRSERTDTLIDSDFVKPEKTESEDELFSTLVGCDEVRAKLKKIQGTIRFCQMQNMDPKDMCGFNYIFTGAPGTGKTTVARLMGKIFRNLGLIPCEDVEEVSASDLITGYVGQAGKKTREMLTKARGKVLFIDEAYQLNPQQGGGFMQEVVDEIVKGLTSEEFKGKMVVILAGYAGEMDAMLGVNPGLRSRFSERIHFHDFDSALVTQLLIKKLQGFKIVVPTPAAEHIKEVIAPKLRAMTNFGNGRDVDNLSKKVIGEIAMRCSNPNEVISVRNADLDAGLAELAKTKQHGASTDSPGDSSSSISSSGGGGGLMSDNHSHKPQQTQFQNGPSAAPVKLNTTTRITTAAAPEEEEEEEAPVARTVGKFVATGFGNSANNKKFLGVFDGLLEAAGLKNEDGVLAASQMDMTDPTMTQFIKETMKKMGLSRQEATELVLDWQSKQNDVRETLKREKKKVDEAKKLGKKMLVPIWRCAVCGAADMPWIVCYVAPYVASYREVDAN